METQSFKKKSQDNDFLNQKKIQVSNLKLQKELHIQNFSPRPLRKKNHPILPSQKKNENLHSTPKNDTSLKPPIQAEKLKKPGIEESIRLHLQSMIENIKQQAYETGYQLGKKEGFEKGTQDFHQEVSLKIKKLDQFLETIENAKFDIFRANEQFLIQLVYQIAKMVILKELETDEKYLLRLFDQLLKKIEFRDYLKIKLHPNDEASISLIQERIKTAYPKIKNLKIEISSEVGEMGLELENQFNAIGAYIEEQLKSIDQQLMNSFL